jgi:hypothetical protein
VDGGSTERWEDAEYRKVYRHLAVIIHGEHDGQMWTSESTNQPTNKLKHLQTPECYELMKTVEKLTCAVWPLPEH